MRHLLFILSSVLLILILPGCGSKPNPLRQAIVDKVKESNPDVTEFEVTELLLENTVSLENELTRRQCVFITKEKTYRKKAEEYARKNMARNAAKNDSIARSATATLERFVAYREAHASRMDSTVYYIFRMKGHGRNSGGLKVEVSDYYVTASPTGEVFSILPPGSNPHKGMGLTIPGYFTEILGHETDTE